MRRRTFITLLGGGAVAWPLRARGQQPERMRRIGILLPAAADDAEFQTRVGAFLQGLQQLGWIIGRNVRIDTRWATNTADIRRHAVELAALARGNPRRMEPARSGSPPIGATRSRSGTSAAPVMLPNT
jgi:putative ABC transport system substrate-binding protein